MFHYITNNNEYLTEESTYLVLTLPPSHTCVLFHSLSSPSILPTCRSNPVIVQVTNS